MRHGKRQITKKVVNFYQKCYNRLNVSTVLTEHSGCGKIEIESSDVVVITDLNREKDLFSYRFTCCKCGSVALKGLNASNANILLLTGATEELNYRIPRADEQRGDLSPVNYEDCAEFSESLESFPDEVVGNKTLQDARNQIVEDRKGD